MDALVPHSADTALIHAQHQRRLDDICQCLHLLIAEHRLEHREDALSRGRVRSEAENNLRCFRPCWEFGAIRSPPEQHLLRE